MRSTPEQRIAASTKLGLLRGLSEEAARAAAYVAEGLAPPAPETREDEIEELRWRLHCAERRADAATRRAQILGAANRLLRAEIETLRRIIDLL